MRMLYLTFLTLFSLIFNACTPTSEAQNLTPKVSIWSEFIPYAEVEAHLPELKQTGAALYIAVRQGEPHYNELAHLMMSARAAGVSVRPWLLLEEERGYWFNKWNFKEAHSFVWSYVNELKKRGVETDWLIFDIEAPRGLIETMQAQLKELDFVGTLDTLSHSSRDGSIRRAIADYASLVDELHSKGIKVHAVTTNFVLNESGESLTYQSALGTPVSGIAWDEISFMVYRAEFLRSAGPMNSRIVYEFAKRARARFGAQAAIDIGEAGAVLYPNPFEGLTDPNDVARDARAVLAAGLANIHTYSLDGMRKLGLKYWFTPFQNKPTALKPPLDAKASLMMAGLDFAGEFLPRGQ